MLPKKARAQKEKQQQREERVESDGLNNDPEEPTPGPSFQGQPKQGRGVRWRAAQLTPNLAQFEPEEETEQDREGWTTLYYVNCPNATTLASTEELHRVQQPFLLCRFKDKVEKDLPKKLEVVVYHRMSSLQKYYKAIRNKDRCKTHPRTHKPTEKCTKPVKVFRLLGMDTVEEDIYFHANSKLKIYKAVIKSRLFPLSRDSQDAALSLYEGEDEDDYDEEEDSVILADSEIQFVSGDVTHPQAESKDAIIIHCLDDSGKWGNGGLFTALLRRSVEVKNQYEMAGRKPGYRGRAADSHHDKQSRASGKDFVTLIVAQRRYKSNKLSGISLAALEEGLKKIYRTAKAKNASVHLPQIGETTKDFSWYGTERLIRKHLASRGIPTFVYPSTCIYKEDLMSSRVTHIVAEAESPAHTQELQDMCQQYPHAILVQMRWLRSCFVNQKKTLLQTVCVQGSWTY
ncbi:hypothetical protein Q7C36_006198 [Tachysurus vachellii]|uniref:Macro domain-containing protein n=1 Tax=Tachysurus vachellii TaxID=175792 RepID=A0AA88NJ33_TACVA|nr:hypothetical protein Q7C36_006198 [Tachysurus vachellii]